MSSHIWGFFYKQIFLPLREYLSKSTLTELIIEVANSETSCLLYFSVELHVLSTDLTGATIHTIKPLSKGCQEAFWDRKSVISPEMQTVWMVGCPASVCISVLRATLNPKNPHFNRLERKTRKRQQTTVVQIDQCIVFLNVQFSTFKSSSLFTFSFCFKPTSLQSLRRRGWVLCVWTSHWQFSHCVPSFC